MSSARPIRRRFAVLALAGVGLAGAHTIPLESVAWGEPQPGPFTVAVAPFANHSGDPGLDALGKGLADMLVTDLQQVSALQVVERGRLQELLRELSLASTGFLDPAAAQKAGRGLGARAVLTGALVVQAPRIRLDARLIEVETGRVLLADSVEGGVDEFFVLEKELANRVVARLDLRPTARENLLLQRVATASFPAMLAWSRALDALDSGQVERARQELEGALRLDGSFDQARRALDRLGARVDSLREQRTRLQAASLEALDEVLVAVAPGSPQAADVPALLVAHMAELMQPANARRALRVARRALDLRLPDEPPAAGRPEAANPTAMAILVQAAAALKDDATALSWGERFLERYPTSGLALMVDATVQRSLQRQRSMARGREVAPRELAAVAFEMDLARVRTARFSAPPDYAIHLWGEVEAAARDAGRTPTPDEWQVGLDAWLRAGRVEQAEALIERAARGGADAAIATRLRARLADWREDDDAWRLDLDRWRHRPTADGGLNVARGAARAFRYQEADSVLDETARRAPQPVPAGWVRRWWHQRCAVLADAGRWEAVLERVAAWEAQPSADRDVEEISRLKQEARDAPRRLKDLEETATWRRAAACLQLSLFPEAGRLLDEFLALPSRGSAIPDDTARYMAAQSWTEAGDFGRARVVLQDLKRLHPDSPMAATAQTLLGMLPDDEAR